MFLEGHPSKLTQLCKGVKMYDQKFDPVEDPALVEVLAGRIRLGQTFDEVVSEGHVRLVAMTSEQLVILRNLVEKKASRNNR